MPVCKLPGPPRRCPVGRDESLALAQSPIMSRVEGDRAGRDVHVLAWHVAPTAVPRDTLSA
eukprot:3144633-Pleurochrysis_carterae.AAC.1